MKNITIINAIINTILHNHKVAMAVNDNKKVKIYLELLNQALIIKEDIMQQ